MKIPRTLGAVRTIFALVLLAILTGIFFLPNLLSASKEQPPAPGTKLETATFGMGCFWCSQALFEKFKGIDGIVCGYAGGHTANPTYEDVCSDQTGHAEVVQISYDPKVITYAQLLDIFWDVHDPTTPDQQGDDVGSQYRSIILYEKPAAATIGRGLEDGGAGQVKQAGEYRDRPAPGLFTARRITTRITSRKTRTRPIASWSSAPS